ncbi:MAG: transcription antitermination factor NusB [Alphaproteobacteria bacterium]
MGLTPATQRADDPTLARLVAAQVLDAVLDAGKPFDQAWSDADAALARLSRRDRAFARLMTTAALRRLGEVDQLLDQFLRRPLPDKAAIAHQVLRLVTVQLKFLDPPPHAAIDQAVRLMRRVGHPALAGLANAVLRRVHAAPLLAPDQAARLNAPPWLLESWAAAHGSQAALDIARAHLEEPPLDLTVAADADGWAERLGGAVLPTGTVRLSHAGDVTALDGYDAGGWWVQDAAAALPARLLAPPPGAAALDMCAAPGGKTAQLAAMGATVTAVERDPRRADMLRANLQRLGLAARVEVGDAAAFTPDAAPRFVLLDAPCSATGTLRRHPDIARLKSADDIRRAVPAQDRLLDRAAALLPPGGRLVYAVCSLQPEEGWQRIDALLARNPALARDAVAPAELPGLEAAITPAGDVMTLPCHWPDRGHLDGFFVARLTRRA